MLRELRVSTQRILPQGAYTKVMILAASVLVAVKRPRGWREFLKSSWSALWRSDTVAGLPIHITIEPTNICNLRCPVCETGARILRRRSGSMTGHQFFRVLRYLGRQVNTVLLYWMGEPFLNPEIYRMLGWLKDSGVWMETCTNGEYVEPDKLVGVSPWGDVSFQFGGASQGTHEVYRVSGNFDKEDEILREVAELKEERRSPTHLTAGLIVMAQNEFETEQFSERYRGVVDEVQLISPCVRTVEQGQQFLPSDGRYWIYDREAFGKGVLRTKVIPKNSCPWIYYSVVVGWNGDVFPCCRDAHGDHKMGNIFDESLAEIWNGERYRRFRRRIATDQANVDICRLCSGFGVPLLK